MSRTGAVRVLTHKWSCSPSDGCDTSSSQLSFLSHDMQFSTLSAEVVQLFMWQLLNFYNLQLSIWSPNNFWLTLNIVQPTVVLKHQFSKWDIVATEPKISGEREMGLLSISLKRQEVRGGKSYIVFCAEKLRSISRLFGVRTCPSLNSATGLDETCIQDKLAPIMNQNSQWESAPDSELSLDVYCVDFYMWGTCLTHRRFRQYSQWCFETSFVSCLIISPPFIDCSRNKSQSVLLISLFP